MRLRLLLLIALIPLCAGLSATGLIYPLQAEPALSSNFGQYRDNHPHGGLDLWTHLRVNTPVLAAANGVIYRIRVAPKGYGRVLYHRLGDGRTAVYAHLAGFAPKIDKLVRRIQRANGGYSFNRVLPVNEQIRVYQGEVIAYAGDTGTDVAHVHFELRDRNGWPINPLANGFPMDDTLAPGLKALHFEPLGLRSHVMGGKDELIVPFARQTDGLYTCDVVTVGGRVGLSVDAYDLLNGSPRHLAPYDLRLIVDGREMFHHRFDRYSYNNMQVSDLSYIFRLKLQRKGFFIRLHRLYERTVLHASDATGDLSHLSAGRHEARIEVQDEHGNQAAGAFALLVEPIGQFHVVKWRRDGESSRVTARASGMEAVRLRLRAGDGEWTEPTLVSNGGGTVEAESPTIPQPGDELALNARDGLGRDLGLLYRWPDPALPDEKAEILREVRANWKTDHLVVQAEGGLVEGAMPLVRITCLHGNFAQKIEDYLFLFDGQRMTLSIPVPKVPLGKMHLRFMWARRGGQPVRQELTFPFQTARGGRHLVSEDGRARIDIPAGGMYARRLMAVETLTRGTPSWLEPVGSGYRFTPTDEPMRRKMYLRIQPPPGEKRDRLGVYLYDEGTWWHIHAGTSARLKIFGEYALARDVSPPVINELYTGHGDRPTLKVMVDDLGSGLYEGGMAVALDGRAQIFEYLISKHQLLIEPDRALTAGEHTLAVTLRDEAGNRTHKRFVFEVRP